MRVRVAAAVALVVLSAGCSGFVGGGESTPTLTPAEVPTPEPTPTDPRVGIAPGVTSSNVTHPGFLAQRHADAVEHTSYVLVERYREDRQFGNVTSDLHRTQRIVVENATVYRREVSNRHRAIVDGEAQYLHGYAEYADGNALYKSWLSSDDNQRVYRRSPDPTQRLAYGSIVMDEISEYLSLENATVTRYYVANSDYQHYQVTGSREALPTYSAVDNYTATAVIREDGFVRSLNVTFEAENNGREIDAHYTFAYSEVGAATVTPPDWVEEAREEPAGDDG